MKKLHLLVCLFIAIVFWGCGTTNDKSNSIDFLVSYGNPPKPGGICTGGGICMRVAVGTTSAPPKSVKSTFAYDAAKPTQIAVSFLKSEIVAADPDEALYLDKIISTAGTPTQVIYQFPNPHALNDPAFQNIGLKPTAVIIGNTPEKVTFDPATGKYTVIFTITQ